MAEIIHLIGEQGSGKTAMAVIIRKDFKRRNMKCARVDDPMTESIKDRDEAQAHWPDADVIFLDTRQGNSTSQHREFGSSRWSASVRYLRHPCRASLCAFRAVRSRATYCPILLETAHQRRIANSSRILTIRHNQQEVSSYFNLF